MHPRTPSDFDDLHYPRVRWYPHFFSSNDRKGCKGDNLYVPDHFLTFWSNQRKTVRTPLVRRGLILINIIKNYHHTWSGGIDLRPFIIRIFVFRYFLGFIGALFFWHVITTSDLCRRYFGIVDSWFFVLQVTNKANLLECYRNIKCKK